MLQVEELAADWSSCQDDSLVQLNNMLAARLHCKPELVSLGELYLPRPSWPALTCNRCWWC